MTTRAVVADLRQYTLLPGQRDTLIELFDRHFVQGQESAGIHVVGQFRDLDDPDRFVWLRGFESMTARGDALPRFYYGPVWQDHRDDANATMLDSDNALLLEPLHLSPGYPNYGGERVYDPTSSVVAITVAHLDGPVTAADRTLATRIRSVLEGTDAEIVAVFATHDADNNFPALPLRDEHVLVWITRFADDAAHNRHQKRLDRSADWRNALTRLEARSSPVTDATTAAAPNRPLPIALNRNPNPKQISPVKWPAWCGIGHLCYWTTSPNEFRAAIATSGQARYFGLRRPDLAIPQSVAFDELVTCAECNVRPACGAARRWAGLLSMVRRLTTAHDATRNVIRATGRLGQYDGDAVPGDTTINHRSR